MNAAVNVTRLEGHDDAGLRARLASLERAIARRGGEVLDVMWEDPTVAGETGATVLYVVDITTPPEPAV